MAAFALSRIFRRTAQRLWLLYFLISLMIPGIATLVPGLFLAKDLHIFNTYWGIILFSVPNAFIVYILKGFIDALPGALFDAARMEGANEVTVFLRLVIPLSKSALAVAVIMLFLGSWNNFFWPFVVISDPNRFTFPVGLFFFTTQGLTYYGVGQSFTYGIVSSLPTIVIFLLFQNQIQKGLVWSGIKG
jgi:multiple sugar transport system permease protein